MGPYLASVLRHMLLTDILQRLDRVNPTPGCQPPDQGVCSPPSQSDPSQGEHDGR